MPTDNGHASREESRPEPRDSTAPDVTGTLMEKTAPVVEPTNCRPMAQQEQSPLFSLPAELRLQIYESALSPSNPESLGVQTGYQVPPFQLCLLETCRLVLHEAAQIFYSVNRLHLISSPQPFPDTLNPRRLSAIKRLTLPVYKAEQTLMNLQLIRAHLPNLESLWLHEVRSSFTSYRAWQNLGDQLVAAMEALPRLRDAKFIPYEPQMLQPGEMKLVKLKIDTVCRRMCALVEAKVPKKVD